MNPITTEPRWVRYLLIFWGGLVCCVVATATGGGIHAGAGERCRLFLAKFGYRCLGRITTDAVHGHLFRCR